MTDTRLNRRRFLQGGTALAGLTAGAVTTATAQTAGPSASPEQLLKYGQRSHHVTSVRVPDEDEVHRHYHRMEGRLTPLQDSMGVITPSPLHFVTMHGY